MRQNSVYSIFYFFPTFSLFFFFVSAVLVSYPHTMAKYRLAVVGVTLHCKGSRIGKLYCGSYEMRQSQYIRYLVTFFQHSHTYFMVFTVLMTVLMSLPDPFAKYRTGVVGMTVPHSTRGDCIKCGKLQYVRCFIIFFNSSASSFSVLNVLYQLASSND